MRLSFDLFRLPGMRGDNRLGPDPLQFDRLVGAA